MDNVGTHPAEQFEADVRVADSRAKAAMVALALTAALRCVLIPIAMWQNGLLHAAESGNVPPRETLELSDTLVSSGALAQLALFIVTGVLFLRWLHRVVKVTRALGGDTLRWTPRDAALSFIIPVVSFARPYQVMRDVHDHLAPDVVPEPPVLVQPGEMSGYRGVEVKAPPPPAKLPHAQLGAWWGFFWVGNIIANIASRQHGETLSDLVARNYLNSAADAVEVVSAVLAVFVVRGVTARLDERYRRTRHNPVEALTAAGITLGDPAV
jgi:Domain of unknown function (DUF4328)